MASSVRRISQFIFSITLVLVVAVGVTSGVSYLEPEDKITDLLHFSMNNRFNEKGYAAYSVTKELQQKIVQLALEDMKHNPPIREALSLEVKMQTRVLEYGATCDHARDAPIEALLKNYNSLDSSDSWYANGKDIALDTVRLQFHKHIVDKNIKVCNPYKNYYCNTTNKCDCKDTLVFKKRNAGICFANNNYRCGTHTKKVFEVDLHQEKVTYYVYQGTNCNSGHDCETLGNFGKVCLSRNSDELEKINNLQLEFERKFIIDINGACSVADQEELFKVAKSFDRNSVKTLAEAKMTIEDMNKKSSRYCRIREHAGCQDGKCVCISPTILIETTCVLPTGFKCNVPVKSDLFEQLEKLNLPLHESIAEHILALNRLTCTTGGDANGPYAHCLQYYVDPEKKGMTDWICHCYRGDKYGDVCEKDTIHHLAHVKIWDLSLTMQGPEGVKIISALHAPIMQLDEAMTIGYDEPCDPNTNQDMASILDFLAAAREECQCSPKTCFDDYGHCTQTNPEYSRTKFEALLRNAVALADKNPTLCNMNRGFRCVDKQCGCGEDYFYEDGKCRVDVGGICYKLRIDDDSIGTCRSGLICDRPRHDQRITRCEYSGELCSDCKTRADYLARAKDILLKGLREEDLGKLLRGLQTLNLGQACNHKNENELKETLEGIDSVIKESTSTGSAMQVERQHIRLLEKLVKSGKVLRHMSFCKYNSHCSKKTDKCEKGSSIAPTIYKSTSLDVMILFLMPIMIVLLLQ